jgi:outer membrane protein OmpA-like peptidoglycan-associated protein
MLSVEVGAVFGCCNLKKKRECNMLQKEMNDENKEIRSKAFELYKEHGFKDGNDFVDWLEAERQMGKQARTRRHQQSRNMLLIIVGILCLIVLILVFMLFRTKPAMDITLNSPTETKFMVLVLDPQDNEKVVVFGDTHFTFDNATLSPEAKTLLDKDVQVMKENPLTHVRMAGYTSAEGSAEVNQKLSESRANAVRDYLIEEGIAPERITVIGYGRTKPAVYEVRPGDINSKEAKANMRVLFEIVVK